MTNEQIGWMLISISIIFIVAITLAIYFKIRSKKKNKDCSYEQLSENTYKHTYNIEQARENLKELFPPIGQRPKEVIIEPSDIFKETINKVTKKSKEININKIVTSLKENAEKREVKITPREVADKILNTHFVVQQDEEQFWRWVDERVAEMTDEERGELQEFVNRNKV